MSAEPVLDASAVLAWVRSEPGADQVDTVLDGAVFSAVNASETAQKLIQHGADGSWAISELSELGVIVTPFTSDDALAAAELWPYTRAAGLSLGDRSCLALAQRRNSPVLTADRAWQKIDVDVDIQLIR